MAPDRESLPSDVEVLRDLVLHLFDELSKTHGQLRHLLEREARPGRPEAGAAEGQGYLFDAIAAEASGQASDDADDAGDEGDGDDDGPGPRPTSRGRAKKRGKRSPLPADLPRDVQRHEISEQDPRRRCQCCNEVMPEVAMRVTEQLEFEPARFKVIAHHQPTYACGTCEVGAIRQAKPAQPIERGIPGPGLLAHVITSHFDDHLPYYRLSEIFAREGVEVSRSSLSRWVLDAADLLEPITEHMMREIMGSRRIHTDDTTWPILDPGRGKTQAAKIWTYIGDERHAHTVFQVTARRTRDAPKVVLTGYKGALQADAYSGYDCIYASGTVEEVACWAHVRRKFEASLDVGSQEVVMLIKQMYQVERQARGLPESERKQMRRERVLPILEKIKECRDRLAQRVRPKSPLATALGYMSNQWDALVRFARTGHLEADNNIAERSFRGTAVGRRNWLFRGSLACAQRAAVLLSLIESCAQNDVNPFEYLRDVLQRVSTHPHSRIDELTPAGWKAARTADARVA